MAVELRVPTAGESITEVMIVEWRKAVGDYVEQDEIIAEIETDKASMELPAPASGVLTEIRRSVGDVAPVGDVIATIDETAARDRQPRAQAESPVETAATKRSAAQTPTSREPIVMPAARRALADAGLTPADATPTGPGGRLLKEDVVNAVRQPARSTASDRREEVAPMSMLRRRIAQRLVEAQHTAAMLTTFNEIDMSAVIELRKEVGEQFEQKYGVKLGFMSFFVKAVIDALKLVPEVNAEIRGDDVVYKNYYDIGVAVGTEKGLVVPVIRDAELLSFAEVEKTIGDLARRARERKLGVDELQGGTFTITNGGVYGSLMSTPILNPPQSGILGMHAIQKRPVAVDDNVVVRPMMYVALSYDHRIVDGKGAVTFLKRVKECVETPERMLVEA